MSQLRFKDFHVSPFYFLIFLFTTSIFVRLLFFPENLPLLDDAVGFYWYAIDLITLDFSQYSNSYVLSDFPNNGWPLFLSLFFQIFESNNYLDYVNLQRILGIILSSLSIFPMFYLSKNFFDIKTSIIISSMFVFAPRMVESSLLGTSEPLFLFLGISSLSLFISDNRKNLFLSFALIGLFTSVRYEGILLLIPFTIIYFYKNKKTFQNIKKYFILIGICFLILIPFVYLRMELTDQDGVFSHVISGPLYYQTTIAAEPEIGLEHFLQKGILNLSKYVGLILIPIFFIFIPYGIFRFFKNRNISSWTLVVFFIIYLIPGFYAYSRGFQDVKYLFILYPILLIISGYTIQRIIQQNKYQNYIFYTLLTSLILLSIIFTSIMIVDFNHEKELFEITKDITNLGITNANRDFDGLMYLRWTDQLFVNQNFPISTYDYSIIAKDDFEIIRIGKGSEFLFKNFDDYIEFGIKNGMQYLLLDGSNFDTNFLIEVFKNEYDYPYLKKIYDSKELGYNHHVKVFEIDIEYYANLKK